VEKYSGAAIYGKRNSIIPYPGIADAEVIMIHIIASSDGENSDPFNFLTSGFKDSRSIRKKNPPSGM